MEAERTVLKDQKFLMAICPNCEMTWLAPGLRPGDRCQCGDCAFEFVVGESPAESLCGNEVADSAKSG